MCMDCLSTPYVPHANLLCFEAADGIRVANSVQELAQNAHRRTVVRRHQQIGGGQSKDSQSDLKQNLFASAVCTIRIINTLGPS